MQTQGETNKKCNNNNNNNKKIKVIELEKQANLNGNFNGSRQTSKNLVNDLLCWPSYSSIAWSLSKRNK